MSNPCEIEMTTAVPTDSEPSVKKPRILRKKNEVKTALTVPQVIILIVSILLMIVTLQVPTILYHKIQLSQHTPYSIGRIDVKTCSIQLENNFTNATLDEFCSEFPPLVTQNQTVYNTCLTNSLASLQSLQSIVSVLNNMECQNSTIPFFCNATQVLCGEKNTFMVDLEEKCVRIRDYDCAVEWRAYEMIFGDFLPDCTSFAKDGNLKFSKAPALVCPEEFNIYCASFCLPSCKNFSEYPTDATIAEKILKIMLLTTGLLGGALNLILCILKRRKKFQFPQIFIVYNTVIFMFAKFLCSGSNVIEAVSNPTRYCQAQGFILHAGILCFCGLISFHLAHLLFALAFPFKAMNFMNKYSKTAHIVEVIVVLVLGLLPGIIVLSTSKYQIGRFPPDTCFPSIDIIFHTFQLPFMIYATFILPMLFTVFLILRRNHQLSHKFNNQITLSKVFCIGCYTPEAKLFILLLYYVVLGTVGVLSFGSNALVADATFKNVENYLKCSLGGYKPECDVYKQNIEEVTRPSYYLALLAYLISCTVNLGNLTYTLQFNDIKKIIKCFLVYSYSSNDTP